MIIQHVTRYSVQEIQDLSAGRRVVILYPQEAYRNLFLVAFLQSDIPVIYWRLSRDALSLVEFVREWAGELGFTARDGVKLLEANDAEAAGKWFADQINEQAKQSKRFVLDELDRLESTPAAFAFFSSLILHLATHVQLIINGRNLWSQPWTSLIESGHAVVLGMRERRSAQRFAATAHFQLEVYGFGSGTAFLNGRELVSWDGNLPRSLFFYFADQQMLTRDQIFNVFWHALRVKEATNVFHVTKRKITESLIHLLDKPQQVEMMTFVNGLYQISSEIALHYDVSDFEHFATLAMRTLDDDERTTYCERAIALYKGTFLETVDMPWVIERREKLRRMYVDTLMQAGRNQYTQGNLMGAFAHFIQASREVPQREDLQRQIMMLYAEMGNPDAARQQYEFLREHLLSRYEIEPSRETRALYESLS